MCDQNSGLSTGSKTLQWLVEINIFKYCGSIMMYSKGNGSFHRSFPWFFHVCSDLVLIMTCPVLLWPCCPWIHSTCLPSVLSVWNTWGHTHTVKHQHIPMHTMIPVTFAQQPLAVFIDKCSEMSVGVARFQWGRLMTAASLSQHTSLCKVSHILSFISDLLGRWLRNWFKLVTHSNFSWIGLFLADLPSAAYLRWL